MLQHAEAVPQKTALILGDQRRSYGELGRRTCQLARALRRAGVGAGDTVGAALHNGFEWFELLNAVGLLGAQLVPIGYRLKGPEIAYMLGDSGATVLLAAADLATDVDRAAADLDWPDAALWVVGEGRWRGRAYEAVLAAEDGAPLADAFPGGGFNTMIYTSGTTGRPKAIERQTDPATAHLAMRGMAQMWGLGADDVTLVAGPCYHTGPASYAQVHLAIGGTAVIMPRYDAAEALALIERYRVTNAFMVPTHFSRILQLEPPAPGRFDLSSLRLVMHSAAPCPPHVKRGIMQVFPPATVTEFYGASEGGFTRITAEQWQHKPGSVGTPWPGHEIHILDADGGALPPGAIGLIYVRAPRMDFRYRGAEEKTRQAFRDGCFTAGDLGWLDADGYLFIADRRTDLIISGGANIYPAEVESALSAHPQIADVAVIGIPDAEMGQTVLAVVELRRGAQASADEIIAFARRDLAHYKCPRRVELIAELPREPQGKVRKRDLIARYGEAAKSVTGDQ
ncbi:MAG: AMP-binding protein [Candidatus Binatia bacterium]